MSKLFAILIISMSVAAPALAGGHMQEQDMIEVIRGQITADREALVAENLNLTAEESEAFWPVYRRFQNERSALVDRRIKILTNFRDNFETLDDKVAKQLLDDSIELEDNFQALRMKFLKDFRKALPEKKVLRYLQIENKIDTIIDYDLAQIVPLAE